MYNMNKALNELNNGRDTLFSVSDSRKYMFIKSKDLVTGKAYVVDAVYTTRGKFGFQTVLMFSDGQTFGRYSFSDDGKKNDVIRNDVELVDAVNHHKLTVTFERYQSKKYARECIGASFEIIDTPF